MKPLMSNLARNASGVALTEFAFALPLLLAAGMGGIELTNYVVVHRRVSDLAVQLSDNASRMGAQTTLQNKPISEREINDVFIGAQLQGGGLDIKKNGRIIISSVEMNADGGQTIKWQRCFGDKLYNSSYGAAGLGATGTSVSQIGPSVGVAARAGTAVMLVEIAYTYKPAVKFIKYKYKDVVETAAFNVRDDRDLSQVYNPDNDPKSLCI